LQLVENSTSDVVRGDQESAISHLESQKKLVSLELQSLKHKLTMLNTQLDASEQERRQLNAMLLK